MRRNVSRLIAASSLALGLVPVQVLLAVSRPRYGGTLRVETAAAISETAGPGNSRNDHASPGTAAFRENFARLLFDGLVTVEDSGENAGAIHPALALSWSHDSGALRWQFALRPGVRLSDGSTLEPAMVAASLGASNPSWRVKSANGSLEIESEVAAPYLLAELALSANAIRVRTANGNVMGTGPFRLSEWQPGRRALLVANDDCWGGRPFLNRIEITMGQPPSAQFLDLQLGRADLTEVGLDEIGRAALRNLRVALSSPTELMALEFLPAGSTPSPFGDPQLRQALAAAIDRDAIRSVLMEKQGDAAGALLPGWISGYAFLFPPAGGLVRGRELRSGLGLLPALRLVYDPLDPLAQLVAGRIVLNARDAGIPVEATPGERATGSRSGIKLVRIRLRSSLAEVALAGLDQEIPAATNAAGAEISHPSGWCPIQCVYESERAQLKDDWIVPLFHLPVAYGIGRNVRNWTESRRGVWRLEDVWIDAQ